jgi:hypothetical protein
MVQVVSNPVNQDTPAQSIFSGFDWLFAMAPWIIIAMLVIGLCIALFFVIRKLEDERKERDDPVYQHYKNIIKNCKQNATKYRINKKYSWWNLLILGLPLFKKDLSNKIYDYNNNLLGFYRGHTYTQDNSLCLLAYKTKFLFFENLFVIQCPLIITPKVLDKNKKIKKVKLNFRDRIIFLPNNNIQIIALGVVKDSYFWFPNYMEQNLEILDLREYTNNLIVESSHSEMVKRVLSTGAQQVEKAMLHNSQLKYNQLTPQKTKIEVQEDE